MKHAARQIVQFAVWGGILVKPDRCQGCNRATPKSQLQGHHADHSRPLDVRWLCGECHGAERRSF